MNNMLPTPYQNFIALSRYARWTGNILLISTNMERAMDIFLGDFISCIK